MRPKNNMIKILSAVCVISFLYFSISWSASTLSLRPQSASERSAANETASWDDATAAKLVKGWDRLTSEQKQQNLELLNARTTPQKVRNNLKARRQPNPDAIPQGETTVGVFLPDDKTEIVNLSTTAEKKEIEKYLKEGAEKDALNSLGIVLAAGGEGSRLMVKLYEEGKISEQEKDSLTKFTMPFAPDGIGSFQQDLLVIAFICKKFGVDIPVLVVANLETEDRIEKLLSGNDLFGLKEIGFVGQDMEVTLIENEDLIAVDKNGEVAFNPNGGGGVMKAINKQITVLKEAGSREKINGFEWFERKFEQKGVKDGKVVSLNSDMEIVPEQLFAFAAAAKGRDAVAVSYPYPKDDIDPTTKEHSTYKYGTFVKLETQDDKLNKHTRLTIIEYANRRDYSNLAQLIQNKESDGFVQANAGLLVFSLALLKTNLENIPQRIQRGKETMDVEGKVHKPEFFVTDLLCYAAKPLIVAMDEDILRPMKDWPRLTSKRKERIDEARKELRDIGCNIGDDAVVQLSVSFVYALRQGDIRPTTKVEIMGRIGVKFDVDEIEIYTLRERLPAKEGKVGDNFLVFDKLLKSIPYAQIDDGTFKFLSLETMPGREIWGLDLDIYIQQNI